MGGDPILSMSKSECQVVGDYECGDVDEKKKRAT